MSKKLFRFHIESGETFTIEQENIYEAIYNAVHVLGIHPRVITKVELVDLNA